jgi:hypothetical protein
MAARLLLNSALGQNHWLFVLGWVFGRYASRISRCWNFIMAPSSRETEPSTNF